MKFQELKSIWKVLFKQYGKKHLKKIFFALFLSVIVAGSTAGIAWLLDPAVKKIFVEQDKTYAWTIPLLIVVAFSSKGLSLYLARINIIRVGQEVAGEIQKKVSSAAATQNDDTEKNTTAIANSFFKPKVNLFSKNIRFITPKNIII